MKIGLNAWTFHYSDPFDKSMQTTKSAGFDGIELNLGVSGWITPETPELELIRIRKKAEEIGLEIPSLCSSLFWKYSLSSSDVHNRNKAIECLKSQIRIASVLGAEKVLCVPGFVGAGFDIDETFKDMDTLGESLYGQVYDYSEAYKRAIESLNSVREFATENHITIALENTGNKFLLSPLEMSKFIDELGGNVYCAYFDVGNVRSIGYPEHWIRALSHRLGMIHLKDYNNTNNKYGKIGEGNLNLDGVISSLKSIGYNGWMVTEYMTPGCWKQENYLSDTVRNIVNAMHRGEK